MTGGAPIFESSQLANDLRVVCCKEFLLTRAQHPVDARTNFGTHAALVQQKYWKKESGLPPLFRSARLFLPNGKG